MSFVAKFRVFVCLLGLFAGMAQASEDDAPRIALVVGNGAYGSISALDNPINDADLIAHTLDALNFDVTLITDGTQIEMKRAIAQFGRDLRQSGPDTVGLFYYAGHGVQSYGTNYLLPVDSALLDAADLDLVAVEAQSVLRQMFSAKNATNIVILDACRDNPFTDIPEFNDNGLAEMDAPTGTFLAYATGPGDVALDGELGNSPFTRSLAGFMTTPGLPIEQMFKQVRVEVLEETDGFQTPWDSSSLTRDFIFASPEDPAHAHDKDEENDWRAAQASGDMLDLIAFLRGYPDSVHADAARKLLVAVLEYDLEIVLERPAEGATVSNGPSDVEEKLFRLASAQGTAMAYQMYLRMYPSGTYADVARLEVAALAQAEASESDAGGARVASDPDPIPEQTVTFIDPLVSDVEAVNGRSIAILMNTVPLYSPMDGLPDVYWKDQACGSCHEWSEDRLCDHATRYLGAAREYAEATPHPFGGGLKKNLRFWAAGGCQ
ncbi:MAG: caspase domain-containing protein [Paracoccaceae bacterium]